jgi:hypothetical protein
MPRGTPKTIAPAVLQAIKLLVDQKQSDSAVGREYGISGGRVMRIWASCADEPEAGLLVKHNDKSTRKSGQSTVKVGKTAAAKLASSSGSSEFDPIPAQKAPKSKTRAMAPPEVAEFEVLAAAVQAQGGPKYADERTVDDAIELPTMLRKSRAISTAQYTRTLQSLTANDEHHKQAKPRASKRAEPKRQRYAPPDEYSESEPSGSRVLGRRGQHTRDGGGDRSGSSRRVGAGLGGGSRGNGDRGRDGLSGGGGRGQDPIERDVRRGPDSGAPGIRPGAASEPAQASALIAPVAVQKRTRRM